MKKICLSIILLFSISIFAKNKAQLVQSNKIECQIIKQSEKMSLNKCDNLKILTLKGTPVERARMHGELMNEEIQRDSMNFFSERIFQEVEDANFIVRGIFKSIYSNWIAKFYDSTPDEYLKEMEAQASGAKVDLEIFQRAFALPDTSAFLVNMPVRGFFNTFVSFGCTSVAKKNSDGHFFYGRNLDFSSTLIFDKYPLMTIQIPEEGSQELKHITFGTDGMQFGGITGVNEAGISFAVHQFMSKDAEKFGMPMLFVGEEVLRKARTLEEAAEIIKKNKPGPLWGFVISDLNKQVTWTVEASSQNFNIRKMDGNSFAQTNHLLATDTSLQIGNTGFVKNSIFRFNKALEMVNKKANTNSRDVAQILSYQSDANGELSASEDILKGETIQAIIFESFENERKINISIDSAPASSGRYAVFNMVSLFSAPEKIDFEINDLSNTPKEKRKNQLKLSLAAQYQDKGLLKEAIDQFVGQKSLDSQIYRAVGFYNIEKYDEVKKIVSELKKSISNNNLSGQSVLWIEMLTLNKLKKTKEAKLAAEEILKLDIHDSNLKKIAEKIKNGKSLDDTDENLKYSLFSGYVTNETFQ